MFIITSNLIKNTFNQKNIASKNTQYYIKENNNVLK